jgi:tetratricopeptide (TPR) repeat protein
MSKKIYHLSLVIISLLYMCSSSQAQSIDDGKKLLKNESYSKAINVFKSLAAQNNNPEAWYYLGETYYEKGNLDSAKISFQNGIQSKSDFGLNYAGLAKVFYNEKNISEGDKYNGEALKIADEKNVRILQAAADAYINAGKDISIKAKDLLDQAIAVTKKNKKKDKVNYILLGDMYNVGNNGSAAVENYKKAIDIDSSAEAFVSIGKIFEIIKNYGEAELSYQQAMKVETDYSVAYKGMAELMYSERKYDLAISNWKKYIELSENTPENQKRLINYVYKSKDYKTAAELINNTLKDDPNNLYMLHMLAYSYSELKDDKNGIPAFNKYFASAKDSDIIISDYEYYANLLQTTGQDSLALIQMQKAAAMDTSRYDLLGKMAALYFKTKKWDKVIEEYKIKLQKTGSLMAQEYFDLGRAYSYINNYADADTSFAMVIKSKPDLPTGYLFRARVSASIDSTSEKGLAKPYYDKLLTLIESDTVKYRKEIVESYSYLGYYYYLKNDIPSAKNYFQKVLILDPENPQAKEAVKNLGKEKQKVRK